jgi:hypothetical protein
MARSLWSAALRPRLAKSERLSVELDAADDSYRQYSTTGAGAGMGHEDLFRLRWLNAGCLFS